MQVYWDNGKDSGINFRFDFTRARFGGKVLGLTKVSLRYVSDKNGTSIMTVEAPDWAHGCSDDVTGTMTFDVRSVVNSAGSDPVEMNASAGFGMRCFWFQADGTGGLQIAPNVSAVIYHVEFATYQNAPAKNQPPQIHPAVHLEAYGDLAYQNYTLALKSVSYDDPGTGARASSVVKVDTPQTVLKNVPAIATFLGAIAARLLVH